MRSGSASPEAAKRTQSNSCAAAQPAISSSDQALSLPVLVEKLRSNQCPPRVSRGRPHPSAAADTLSICGSERGGRIPPPPPLQPQLERGAGVRPASSFIPSETAARLRHEL